MLQVILCLQNNLNYNRLDLILRLNHFFKTILNKLKFCAQSFKTSSIQNCFEKWHRVKRKVFCSAIILRCRFFSILFLFIVSKPLGINDKKKLFSSVKCMHEKWNIWLHFLLCVNEMCDENFLRQLESE